MRNNVKKVLQRQKTDRPSVRVYGQANRSRFFEDIPLPLTQTEKNSRHPQFLFDSYQQRKLSSPGQCHYLSGQSADKHIRLVNSE